MTGAAMKNLRMFRKLCGEEGLSCVVLATTMWSRTPTEREERREKELISQEDFWAGMIRRGSTVFRQDSGSFSATEIIRFILSQRRQVTLKIQQEMAGGMTLDQTAAGQEVQAEIDKLKAKHQEEMVRLRQDMEEARRENDVRAQREIEAIRASLQRQLDEEEKKREALRVNMQELQSQREREESTRERECCNGQHHCVHWYPYPYGYTYAYGYPYEVQRRQRRQSGCAIL